MPIETLDIAEPFFTLRLIEDEASHAIGGRAVVLNLAETPVRIRDQNLASLTSVIVQVCTLNAVQHVAQGLGRAVWLYLLPPGHCAAARRPAQRPRLCPVPGLREVHTQIVGFGKMQQCRERDISTLYLEEPMAPGTTHRPLYDAMGNCPWHQFETITPSIFMAVEMLPDGASPPA